MSPLRRKLFGLAAVLVLCAGSLRAQTTVNGVSPVSQKSPVAMFRELLAMSPAERKAAIAIRPPDIQKRILEKLSEYEILPGDLREQRLRETELRWYLRPLMDEPRTNRAARLAVIPEPERTLVKDRLQMWDLLPPALQEEWKNDEMVADYFAQLEAAPEQTNELTSPPEGLRHWVHMSLQERQKALAGFNKFFELPPEEKEKTLDDLSDDERQQIKQTLDAYGNLTPEQRQQCIRSFEKFASMSAAERNQFLKNAERWNEMTPEERQKWRELVTVAPIMPPWQPNAPSSPPPNRSSIPVPPAVATN